MTIQKEIDKFQAKREKLVGDFASKMFSIIDQKLGANKNIETSICEMERLHSENKDAISQAYRAVDMSDGVGK